MEWRCPVCGKRMKGRERPAACSLCGVAGSYIVPEAEYRDPGGPLHTDQLADLDRALALEEEATRIYRESANRARTAGDEATAVFFDAFAKNEHGHQAAIKFQKKARNRT